MSKTRMFFQLFCALVCAALAWIWSEAAQAQVVAFGASNVAGYGVSSSDAFPAQLEGMLKAKGYNVNVQNAGVSGNTTTDMLNRVDSDIPAGTKVVILDTSGGFFNDARNGISREQGRADMGAIVAKLKARGIKIVPVTSIGILPSDRQADGIHATAEGHRIIASELLPRVAGALSRAH
jgi:acyl-CoA thioesterase-1